MLKAGKKFLLSFLTKTDYCSLSTLSSEVVSGIMVKLCHKYEVGSSILFIHVSFTFNVF